MNNDTKMFILVNIVDDKNMIMPFQRTNSFVKYRILSPM
jgi:hypothetical protein